MTVQLHSWTRDADDMDMKPTYAELSDHLSFIAAVIRRGIRPDENPDEIAITADTFEGLARGFRWQAGRVDTEALARRMNTSARERLEMRRRLQVKTPLPGIVLATLVVAAEEIALFGQCHHEGAVA